MQIVTAPALTASTPDAGSLVLIALLSTLPTLVLYVWTALALSRVYTKIGVAGWKAWVPVYNAVVFLRLGGLSGWLLLLLLIPVFGVIFVYVAIVTSAHRINLAFGHGAGMTVLAALLFPVWASVLGFGPAEPDRTHEPYAAAVEQDPADAFRALSPDFGRLDTGEAPDLLARRDVPAPSAWIPAAPAPAFETPAEPAPAPVPEPSASPAAAAAPAAPEPSAPAAVPAPPTWEAPEPATWEAPAAAPAEPAPVTSWWMPAPEAEPQPEPAGASAPDVDADEPETPEWLAAAPAPSPAPQAPAERVETPPVAPPARPVLRQPYVAEPDAFPEDSGAVSAVVGSPTAGAPRPAAASVSAFRPGMSDAVDDTVIAVRKRPAWALQLPDGSSVDLTVDAVVLGRRPAPVHAAPGAQLVEVVEETRTVSKTHALLRRQGEAWLVSDLGSTNGVVVDDTEVEQGQSVAVEGEFLLGDAVLRIVRRER
ncbi:DUF5684 domain-containing protein [Microbacterium sp. GXF7504]